MSQPVSLLLVDDDAVFLDALSGCFTHRGYQVHAFTDPPAAEAFANHSEVDAALVDLGFPCGGGMQLVELLNQTPSRPGIVVLSGYTDLKLVDEARQLGAHAYLNKPCSFKRLETAVRKVIAEREQALPTTISEVVS